MVGLLLIVKCQAAKALLPKVGLIVFKLMGPGVYNPSEYAVNLRGIYLVAYIAIAVGLWLSIIFYRAGIKKD
jgi:hypothetical protein